MTSTITVIELLSIKTSTINLAYLEELFLEIPNMTTYDLTYEIAQQAARIRRDYGYRLADSI